MPLAYFIATRATKRKGLFVVLLVIPFWTSFLIRTIAWLTILGPRGVAGFLSDVTGNDFQILGTPVGDPARHRLQLPAADGLPALRDPRAAGSRRCSRRRRTSGAARWATFRQVTLPIIWPGLITGSILVFIPLMGEYVIPSILGRGKIFLIGNVLQLDFLVVAELAGGLRQGCRADPIMLISVTFYVWIDEPRPARP